MVRGEFVKSPKFDALGNQWRLQLYPGGCDDAAEGMVSLYLWNMSNKAIDIDYGFSVSDGNVKQVAYKRSDGPRNFAPEAGDDGIRARGWQGFATRSEILSSQITGTLIIEVHMKLAGPTKSVPPPFIPENPSSCKIIQGLFMNDDSADIMFVVGWTHCNKHANKKTKTETLVFPAHRFIVRKFSSLLSELCGPEEWGDKTTTIEISDVSPHVFNCMLYHMYGHKTSDSTMKALAREILDAANRYGIIDLKLEAEAYLVKSIVFDVDNLLGVLLYADSKNCALLKEAAMDYMLKNRGEVLKKVTFHDAPGLLLTDFLAAMAREDKKGKTDADSSEDKLMAMRISDLRKKAHGMGLEVDGSREMLIATIQKKAEADINVGANDNSDEDSDYEFTEDSEEASEDDSDDDTGEESGEES